MKMNMNGNDKAEAAEGNGSERERRGAQKKVECKFVFAFNVFLVFFVRAAAEGGSRTEAVGGKRRKYSTKDLYSVSLIKFS